MSHWIDEGDEEIARIREVRHRISEECGHDPARLVAYYMERQKEYAGKLIKAPDLEAKGQGRDERQGVAPRTDPSLRSG